MTISILCSRIKITLNNFIKIKINQLIEDKDKENNNKKAI